MRDLYAAEVTMTDHWLGMLVDRLHELNLERETVIVLVGDHGILLGEHGWTGKISDRPLPRPHARAADRGPPATAAGPAGERLVRLDARRGAHAPVDGRRAPRPSG